MKLSHIFTALTVLFISASCTDNPTSDWEEVNLLEHGAAVTIKAPKGVKVESSDFMGQKDIVIKDSTDYKLQIFISDASTGNLNDEISNLKSDVREMQTFEKMVDSFKHGFIFKTKLDSTISSYDFRYIEEKGDKEIQFQMGMGEIFSKEQVDRTLSGIRNKQDEN